MRAESICGQYPTVVGTDSGESGLEVIDEYRYRLTWLSISLEFLEAVQR